MNSVRHLVKSDEMSHEKEGCSESHCVLGEQPSMAATKSAWGRTHTKSPCQRREKVLETQTYQSSSHINSKSSIRTTERKQALVLLTFKLERLKIPPILTLLLSF